MPVESQGYVASGNDAVRVHGVRMSGEHPGDWVCERQLNSRQFYMSSSSWVTREPRLYIVVTRGGDARSQAEYRRPGWGSLRGRLSVSADWDSGEVNEEIAHEFGF